MTSITQSMLLEAADHLDGDGHSMSCERADAVAAWLRTTAADRRAAYERCAQIAENYPMSPCIGRAIAELIRKDAK